MVAGFTLTDAVGMLFIFVGVAIRFTTGFAIADHTDTWEWFFHDTFWPYWVIVGVMTALVWEVSRRISRRLARADEILKAGPASPTGQAPAERGARPGRWYRARGERSERGACGPCAG